jgi:ammonium transporter, Amt family
MLDGLTEASGAVDGNGIQVGYQLAEICAISSYSFVCTCLLLLILKYIPGLHLRVSKEAEHSGLDSDQFIDESIGDWNLFDHLVEHNSSRLDSSPPTPPTELTKPEGLKTH